MSQEKTVAIVYNTYHYVYMFRLNLIKRLQEEGYKVYAIAPHDRYAEKLAEEGVTCVDVAIDNKGTSPVNDMKLIMGLYSIYKKISPDVILHYTIKPNIYGTIAAKIANIPVVNNITGLGTVFLQDSFVQKVTKALYKVAFRRADMIFFQNRDDLRVFINNRIVSKGAVDILPGSGVDTRKYKSRVNPNRGLNIVFLFIGRVIKDKGVIEYVDAARALTRKYDDIEFQILGQIGAENRSAIGKDEVDGWVEEGIINYLGTTDDVRDQIAASDCVVLPSYREGTSKSLLEAASMAKPIVTADVPGCNNIVEHAYNGLLCEVKDCKDLEAKMEEMYLFSDEKREEMGQNGRKKMVAEFTEDIVIDKYLHVINELASGKELHVNRNASEKKSLLENTNCKR